MKEYILLGFGAAIGLAAISFFALAIYNLIILSKENEKTN